MNKFEKEVVAKLNTIIGILQQKENKLEFEDHNFKVNSDGWRKITVDGEAYLVNQEEDIWEIIDNGEQLFTWDAMIRETKKAGKVVPTDEQFTELFKNKKDIPNLVYAGYRYTDGSFASFGSTTYFWSVSPSSTASAWYRSLYSSLATVYRNSNAKAYGFSVRCLKN